jgi:quercetin dioxygenase-like cupin family protein
MNEEIFRQFADIEVKEMSTGFFSKLIHTDNNTINFIDIKAGSNAPIHSHPHHQCAFVLKGEFEMTVGEETQILNTGKFVLIPGNTLHGGRAITDCTLLDIFSPGREDFKTPNP